MEWSGLVVWVVGMSVEGECGVVEGAGGQLGEHGGGRRQRQRWIRARSERGERLFSRLIVAVANNVEKSPLFSPDERVEMIRAAIQRRPTAGSMICTNGP